MLKIARPRLNHAMLEGYVIASYYFFLGFRWSIPLLKTVPYLLEIGLSLLQGLVLSEIVFTESF
jgi:hypothetical protein